MTKEDKDVEQVRAALRKAAEVKDPKDMWFLVRDTLNLLTFIVVEGLRPSSAAVSSEKPLKPKRIKKR